METLFIDGRKIETKEELHNYIKERIEEEYNVNLTEISNEEIHRGKKHKPAPQQGPKKVYLKYMFPYKIEVDSGERQAIFGVLVDNNGRPVRNAVIEFELSDYDLGTMTFSPAISFADGCFFTTFIGECCGKGCITMTARGTDLNKVIPVSVCYNNCYY